MEGIRLEWVSIFNNIVALCMLNNSLSMFFLPTGSCYYHLNQPSGSFASPNHPGCYPVDKYCTWLIEVPLGQYIYLHFLSFHLEYGSAFCPWDFVEIFDGHAVHSSSKIIRACGQLAPWTVYSSGRFLLVKFYSDGIIMMPGFSANYQAVSNSKNTSRNNRGCIRKLIKITFNHLQGKIEEGLVPGGGGLQYKKNRGARRTI